MIMYAQLSAKDIAQITGGELVGNPDTQIIGLNRIEYVDNGELTFYSDAKFEKFLAGIKAACILVPMDFHYGFKKDIALIKVEKPHDSLVKILLFLNSLIPKLTAFIHPAAVIDKSAEIDKSAYIGPRCIIGKNCKIGAGVVLHSNISLYDNVVIGDNTFIHSGVICCSETSIGKNCIIQPGVVIGSDGFGFVENNDGSYSKIPQLGNVIIKDDVEIGSNTTIDRALVGSTIIEKGVKIDNLCQIAHNVIIGENTALAAQVGIAGSCTIGKRNRLGGQVGLAGHLETTDDVVVLAQSGVAKTVEKKGIYFGSPIKERLHAFKIEASLLNLPEMAREVERLKRQIEKK